MFWPGGSGRVGQDHRPRAGVCWPVVDEGGGHTISPSFWMNHYVTSTDPVDVARAIKRTGFASRGETAELAHFSDDRAAPNILISPGSGGHAYVFAELAYLMHLAGYSVFIMPAHGGRTVDQLLVRHRDALDYIATEFNDTIAAYGEGLGGYVVFYLALAHASAVGSIVCQNSPAILTEQAYHDALLADGGPWTRSVRRRRLMLPIARRLARITPRPKVPVSSYLSWKDLIDTREDTRAPDADERRSRPVHGAPHPPTPDVPPALPPLALSAGS